MKTKNRVAPEDALDFLESMRQLKSRLDEDKK